MRALSVLGICLLSFTYAGCTLRTPDFGDYPAAYTLQIHIISGPEYFPDELLRKTDAQHVLGCAVPSRNALYVIGQKTEYGFAVPPETLGHELLELLSAHDAHICGPHDDECLRRVQH